MLKVLRLVGNSSKLGVIITGSALLVLSGCMATAPKKSSSDEYRIVTRQPQQNSNLRLVTRPPAHNQSEGGKFARRSLLDQNYKPVAKKPLNPYQSQRQSVSVNPVSANTVTQVPVQVVKAPIQTQVQVPVSTSAQPVVNKYQQAVKTFSKATAKKKAPVKVKKVVERKPVIAQKPKANMIRLNELPKQFGSWELDVKSSNPSDSQCVVRNRPIKMKDGNGHTPMMLEVGEGVVRVITQSDIDLSYNGTGIKVDQSEQASIDTLANYTDAVFELEALQIINQMKKGHVATVTLGFWPTWPVSQTYSANVDLNGFSAAVKGIQQCQQQLALAAN